MPSFGDIKIGAVIIAKMSSGELIKGVVRFKGVIKDSKTGSSHGDSKSIWSDKWLPLEERKHSFNTGGINYGGFTNLTFMTANSVVSLDGSYVEPKPKEEAKLPKYRQIELE